MEVSNIKKELEKATSALTQCYGGEGDLAKVKQAVTNLSSCMFQLLEKLEAQ